MSQRTRLASALARPIRTLLRGFGVPCAVRRPVELDDQPDNSTSVHWTRVDGLDETVPIVLEAMRDVVRRTTWGEQSDATVEGIAALAHGLQPGDIVRPTDGSFAGRYLKVAATMPSDIGGAVVLALTVVPERADYGF